MSNRVEELRAALIEAEAVVKQEDEARRKLQQARWAEIIRFPGSWEWSVAPTTYRDFGGEIFIGARIMRRIKPEILGEWKQGGTATFHSDDMDGQWLGMFYHRTDENILTHIGGGHLILRDPKLCSDSEWSQILAGMIPMKFLR